MKTPKTSTQCKTVTAGRGGPAAQCIHSLISAGVSIRKKKDRNFRSFLEMLILGAQSTDLDVQTHF